MYVIVRRLISSLYSFAVYLRVSVAVKYITRRHCLRTLRNARVFVLWLRASTRYSVYYYRPFAKYNTIGYNTTKQDRDKDRKTDDRTLCRDSSKSHSTSEPRRQGCLIEFENDNHNADKDDTANYSDNLCFRTMRVNDRFSYAIIHANFRNGSSLNLKY